MTKINKSISVAECILKQPKNNNGVLATTVNAFFNLLATKGELL